MQSELRQAELKFRATADAGVEPTVPGGHVAVVQQAKVLSTEAMEEAGTSTHDRSSEVLAARCYLPLACAVLVRELPWGVDDRRRGEIEPVRQALLGIVDLPLGLLARKVLPLLAVAHAELGEVQEAVRVCEKWAAWVGPRFGDDEVAKKLQAALALPEESGGGGEALRQLFRQALEGTGVGLRDVTTTCDLHRRADNPLAICTSCRSTLQ